MNVSSINRERIGLLVIGLSSLTAVLPTIYFLLYERIPGSWLREGGIYETFGAVACLAAGLLSLYSLKKSLKLKQPLWCIWMLFFAVVCFLIAGEEINWGQRFFSYHVPDSITATNFQGEFNLHNSMLIQSRNNSISSILSKFLMLYFILLPMLIVGFPTIQRLIQRMMIPVPSMKIAIVALLVKVADLVNHKVIYGWYFKKDNLHIGEGMESMFEFCILLLSVECLYLTKKKEIALNEAYECIIPKSRSG
jgi:hypothetical protein